ncbi:hypothetical protein I551_9069 [Mycobacterium ulcerans str. Harvey]|uniref:Uncharacterized protein n=1 Tax=Mycobacterium ulcerans str. Harvey TaxID=1299332 RepID=A0ABP3AUY9_MYCUL|nr:hypothetical protein I551_9069 [Mycobacterium ulcerans str. Harvey]
MSARSLRRSSGIRIYEDDNCLAILDIRRSPADTPWCCPRNTPWI